METLEGETSYRGLELKKEIGHCSELQKEITATRTTLDTAKENVSSLEVKVREVQSTTDR